MILLRLHSSDVCTNGISLLALHGIHSLGVRNNRLARIMSSLRRDVSLSYWFAKNRGPIRCYVIVFSLVGALDSACVHLC